MEILKIEDDHIKTVLIYPKKLSSINNKSIRITMQIKRTICIFIDHRDNYIKSKYYEVLLLLTKRHNQFFDCKVYSSSINKRLIMKDSWLFCQRFLISKTSINNG